ncbi:uncharacterized protein LOC113319756 [Papaver somniferum]|uniref:uncharacterized protein LOC113319756 n=1 Tax=Papaver somniferum TaxID=3469 RepID=UPI000E6FD466|nr:uncharacterized protein LOC113319756 [Papaver somniferum]
MTKKETKYPVSDDSEESDEEKTDKESDDEMTDKESDEETMDKESDEEMTDKESDEEMDKESDDTVCSICDNGGRVLCCDGECKRCFHATVGDAGNESSCKTLGLSKAELAAPKFICLNCQHKQHQCFACGKLGSSDCSSIQEVFSCASCGHFYHSKCVADLLYPGNEVGSKHLQETILTGGSFACPAHKCHECKQDEDSRVRELQFAICRRCPRAYHRKCLPRDIAYAGKRGLVKRSWCNLLPRNRILIYCLNHEIEKGQATPSQDHIVFPDVKRKAQPSSQQKVLKRKRIISEEFQRSVSAKKTNQVEMLSPTKQSKFVENNVKRNSVQSLDSTNGLSTNSASETTLKGGMKSSTDQSLEQQKVPTSSVGSETLLGAEAKRAKNLVAAPCSMTLSDYKKEYKNKVKLEKCKGVKTTNSQEKAETTHRADRTALQKCEEYSKLDESKDVFDPKIINQITQCKVVDKLRAYVHKGDTVVNVAYSANDFTCSMKQRLEGSGKDCSFKDYDMWQSKNVGTVDESDWLSVRRLATGSKLILCLNVPVGISSSVANNSIDKALDFKPKLLVLFVPADTKRLEKKHSYELIWNDSERLSSKFLPSSVRISDNQIKLWNSKPPVVYFWSRTDWCPEHKKIARMCGHIPTSRNDSNVEAGEEIEVKKKENKEEEEEEKEDQESEQDHENRKTEVVTSVLSNEVRCASPNNQRSIVSSAADENQDQQDKKEKDEAHRQEKRRNGMPPSSSAPGENEKAFVLHFAPGPYIPYSHDKHSCCGWISDDE